MTLARRENVAMSKQRRETDCKKRRNRKKCEKAAEMRKQLVQNEKISHFVLEKANQINVNEKKIIRKGYVACACVRVRVRFTSERSK